MSAPQLPARAPALHAELPLDQHPAAVYLARLAPGSRRTMRDALEDIAELLSSGRLTMVTLNWGALRYQHTAAVRAALAERHAPATVNKMLSALRGVLKEAWRLGQIGAEAYGRATDLPSLRGSGLPKGRALASGELRGLFEACAADKAPAGFRDAAILAVLYGAGLRRSELVALTRGDYHTADGTLRVRRGKGRKARMVYATGGLAKALEAWLKIRGDESGALFCPLNKNGTLAFRHMNDQAIVYILRKRARQAKVDVFSPHDLRRTFIGDLLDAGADISTVQALAGHANVQTTARYDRRGEAVRRRAAEMLHVPFG
ncbi:MAG: tyrosine-type recombinase/integrase [Gammaproteobacteria bacterium]|nr:tyrosine-type recombinase/integrase [Gammaproteobacteria bacterium]